MNDIMTSVEENAIFCNQFRVIKQSIQSILIKSKQSIQTIPELIEN